MLGRLLALIICGASLMTSAVVSTNLVLGTHGIPQFCGLLLGEFCLITDLSSYHLGDTVRVQGFVPEPEPDQFVRIQVYNSRDELFFSKSISPSQDGWFDASFQLVGEGAIGGLWTVNGFYASISTKHTFSVEADSKIPSIIAKGIVLTVPGFMKLEIERYLKEISDLYVPKNYFLMIARDALYLVLSDEVPAKGIAIVKGNLMKEFSWKDYVFSVLKADSINIQTEGEPASIGEIRADPPKYHLRLVKISGELQRISAVFNVLGQDLQLGFTTVEGKRPTELAKAARDFVRSPTEQAIMRSLGITEDTSFILNTGILFWGGDISGHVHAVVIVPRMLGKDVSEFIGEVNRLSGLTKKPRFLLYEVQTEIDTVRVTSVRDVLDNIADFKGKTISLTSNAQGVTMSIREFLRLFTGGDFPADVVLHGMTAWSTSPKEAKIRVYGLSSQIQKTLRMTDSGLFEIKGRVVTGKMIDNMLPDIPAIHVLEMSKLSGPMAMPLEEQQSVDLEVSVIENELESVMMQIEESPAIEDVTPKVKETPPTSKTKKEIRLIAKHTKKLTLLSVKNDSEEDIFGIKIKITEDAIKYVKARGWDRQRMDHGTVMVSTNDRPIIIGGNLIILLIVDNPNTAIEWSATNKSGVEISKGIALKK